jgi:hypothetical protein
MIGTIASLSTAHISVEDNNIFMMKEIPPEIPMLTAYDGGWIFYKRDDKEEMVKDLVRASLSPYAIMLFEYVFFDLKVDFLRLDMDADVIKKLPVFDW